MKAVIGISVKNDYENRIHTLKDDYINAIHEAHGIPILLPSTNLAEIDALFSLCQGFLLSGGGDLDPVYWGEFPHLGLGEIDPKRDQFELHLAKKCLEKRVPVLGICRGCQVMNVAAGGTLWQNIKSELLHIQRAPYDYGFHAIKIEASSRLHRILGQSNIRVNSFHHQAVRTVGRELQSTAWSEDGMVEAIEHEGHPFWLGVQWHPELMHDKNSKKLFAALVAAAENLITNNGEDKAELTIGETHMIMQED